MGKEAVVPLLERPYDWLFVIFFLLHIPITVLTDSQVVLPKSWFPPALRAISQRYVEQSQDFLIASPPIWVKSLVWCGIVVQLPFYVAASYAFIFGREWIRLPAVVYGAHTATCLVPIIAEIINAPLPKEAILMLLGIYGPFLIMPLLVLLRALLSPKMFRASGSLADGKKVQ